MRPHSYLYLAGIAGSFRLAGIEMSLYAPVGRDSFISVLFSLFFLVYSVLFSQSSLPSSLVASSFDLERLMGSSPHSSAHHLYCLHNGYTLLQLDPRKARTYTYIYWTEGVQAPKLRSAAAIVLLSVL